MSALIALFADATPTALGWQSWVAVALVGLLIASPIAWAGAVWAMRKGEIDARWRAASTWVLAGSAIGAVTGMMWVIMLSEGAHFGLVAGAAMLGAGSAIGMRILCGVRV